MSHIQTQGCAVGNGGVGMGPLLLPAVQEMQGWSRSTGVGVVRDRGIRSNQRLRGRSSWQASMGYSCSASTTLGAAPPESPCPPLSSSGCWRPPILISL